MHRASFSIILFILRFKKQTALNELQCVPRKWFGSTVCVQRDR